jgi:hypothetical protein
MNDNDWLDDVLRRDAARAVPDDGFTERVIKALPARAALPWLKPALIVGSTLVGSLLAAVLSPLGTQVGAGLLDLARGRTTPEVAVVLAMTTVVVVAAWMLATDD